MSMEYYKYGYEAGESVPYTTLKIDYLEMIYRNV